MSIEVTREVTNVLEMKSYLCTVVVLPAIQWSVWMECPLWAVLWMEAMDRHYERLAGIIVPPHERIHECICAYRTDIGLDNSAIPMERVDGISTVGCALDGGHG